MKCTFHPEAEAIGTCIRCGKPVCATCCTVAGGRVYCPSCVTSVFAVGGAKQTCKPTAAGILGITAGGIALVIGIVLIAVGATASEYYCGYSYCDYRNYVDWLPVGYGIALLLLGFLAILGSSLALARRAFVMAIIGAIAAVVAIWPLGLPALILISLSSNEFKP